MGEVDEFLSDQDEWDTLNDATLQKTIGDILSQNKFELGDRVEVVSGQC
jgi:hypothetical protein